MPEADFQILRLTEQFYNDYPANKCPEVLTKDKRAYTCLLFETHNYFIAVPFRSEINHKYAFRFHHTGRSIKHNSGLDYTKIVILTKTDYIEPKDAVIDTDEYRDTVKHIDRIKQDALGFVEDYITYNKLGGSNLSKEEYNRRYLYSPLKYFHKELGMEE